MKNLWITLPSYAGDYSGVCSALFDLGGLVVIHDASGCTGNYTGYDEPRWYGSSSKVFCSGLRDIDAVLGLDDKLINNILDAGRMINPTMYALVGSPVPMVIGTDTKGIAREIEERTGKPALGFDANGLTFYNGGISRALVELIKKFSKDAKEKINRGINVLGANALDLSANENAEDIYKRLDEWGFRVIGKLPMGATIPMIEDLSKAEINLVVSDSGIEAAKLLEKKYGIPYAVGMPIGNEEDVKELLEETLKSGQNTVLKDKAEDGSVIIVGEQVMSNALRRLILKEKPGEKVTVATLCKLKKELAAEGDIDLKGEEDLIELIKSHKYKTLIGDVLFEDLLEPGDKINHIVLPHVALSSKIAWDDVPRLLSGQIYEILRELIKKAA